MQYIEAPSDEEVEHVSIFLAGGITNCPDWQQAIREIFAPFDITIFNPRREKFPIDDPNAAAEQIRWEYERLRKADINLFWFAAGSLNPIVLFEYGSAMERGKPIVVGCDPEYERIQDVRIQTMLRRPDIIVHNRLDVLAADAMMKATVFTKRVTDGGRVQLEGPIMDEALETNPDRTKPQPTIVIAGEPQPEIAAQQEESTDAEQQSS